MKRLFTLIVSLLFILAMGTVAQEQELEQAGQNIEQAAEEAGQDVEQAAEEAGQDVEQAAEETGQDIETAAQDVEMETDLLEERVSLSAVRMDTLRDYEMVTADGLAFGSIDDIVISRDGEIKYLVVSLGGDALGYGWGYEQYLIPPQAISLNEEDELLVMQDVALEDMAEYPGLETGYFDTEWGYGDAWDDDYMGWWGTGYGYEFDTGFDEEWGFGEFEGERTAILGSELLDYDFYSPEGEDLGDAEGMMLDLENKRVLYVALSAGGFLGLGDTNIAVPLKAIRFNAEEEELWVNISEETIDEIEGFEEAEPWPTEPNRALFEQS